MKLYLYDITNHTHEVYICRENAYIKTQVGQSTTSAFLVRSTSCAVVHLENARQNKRPLIKKNNVAMSWYNDNGIHMVHQCGFKNTMVIKIWK